MDANDVDKCSVEGCSTVAARTIPLGWGDGIVDAPVCEFHYLMAKHMHPEINADIPIR